MMAFNNTFNDIEFLILVITIMLLILASTIIFLFLFIINQKKKYKTLLEKIEKNKISQSDIL